MPHTTVPARNRRKPGDQHRAAAEAIGDGTVNQLPDRDAGEKQRQHQLDRTSRCREHRCEQRQRRHRHVQRRRRDRGHRDQQAEGYAGALINGPASGQPDGSERHRAADHAAVQDAPVSAHFVIGDGAVKEAPIVPHHQIADAPAVGIDELRLCRVLQQLVEERSLPPPRASRECARHDCRDRAPSCRSPDGCARGDGRPADARASGWRTAGSRPIRGRPLPNRRPPAIPRCAVLSPRTARHSPWRCWRIPYRRPAAAVRPHRARSASAAPGNRICRCASGSC